MKSSRNAWIVCGQPKPQATLRLFCFTYAGGGTTFFNSWNTFFPDWVEICPIRLPGRESRLRETPLTNIKHIVSNLIEPLQPNLGKPFAFYGHSMGGIVAFETIRALRNQRLPIPSALFVSGCRAPHRPDPDAPIHNLPDDEFIPAISRLNGTPTAVLENKELLALMIPILRADFQAIEEYRYLADNMPLNCPITAICGQADPKANAVDMSKWKMHTAGNFSQHIFPGDHFFIHQTQFPPFLSKLIAQI